jgi:hypothetical protein
MEDLTPYIFDPKPGDPFDEAINRLKNAYFWAEVLEVGSGVQHGSVSTSHGGFEYYIVEPAPESSNNLIFTPEEFIQLMIGHPYGGKFYGYSWTINQMANDWKKILKEAYPHRRAINVNTHALRIDHRGQVLSVVTKEEAWQHIDILPF